jgi:hypothetical protein
MTAQTCSIAGTGESIFSVVVPALLGAAIEVASGRGDACQFALATLLMASIIYSLSIAWRFERWSGPIPIYFEHIVWAIYPIFRRLGHRGGRQAALAFASPSAFHEFGAPRPHAASRIARGRERLHA